MICCIVLTHVLPIYVLTSAFVLADVLTNVILTNVVLYVLTSVVLFILTSEFVADVLTNAISYSTNVILYVLTSVELFILIYVVFHVRGY